MKEKTLLKVLRAALIAKLIVVSLSIFPVTSQLFNNSGYPNIGIFFFIFSILFIIYIMRFLILTWDFTQLNQVQKLGKEEYFKQIYIFLCAIYVIFLIISIIVN